jgi:hypothetical protein
MLKGLRMSSSENTLSRFIGAVEASMPGRADGKGGRYWLCIDSSAYGAGIVWYAVCCGYGVWIYGSGNG